MPRVSQEHRDRRRREIMEVAWRLFATNGFHATSMDDVIEASGTSASGVYRYVRGKHELIAGAGEESTRIMRDRLRALAFAEPVPTPADALRALLEGAHDAHASPFSLLAIQAWSEALRNPELADAVATFHLEVRTLLQGLASRWASLGLLGEDPDADAVGYALAMLIPGMLVHEHLVGTVDVDGLAASFGLAH